MIDRRGFLRTGAALGTLDAAGYAVDPSRAGPQPESRDLRGYFRESFEKQIFPDFTKATGIAVESIGEPPGEAWLVQLQAAAPANQAPADVSMMAQERAAAFGTTSSKSDNGPGRRPKPARSCCCFQNAS